ncbi:hypothetical protein [Pseudomonas alvandae]|uniref:hypothetical protein n=1 Tax=Pseudomonas canavaninivorans TaxID=2842348 RepID=UPI002FF0EDAF
MSTVTPSSSDRRPEQARSHKNQILESTKGSRSSPLILSSRALFLLLRGGLLLFLAAVALYRCFWRSPSGIKSKRIFLSADLLFRLAIQPIRELPEGSFIVLCPVVGCSWKHPEKHIFSKKIC